MKAKLGMTQIDFQSIEEKLGVTLPGAYIKKIEELLKSERAAAFEGEFSSLFVDTESIVRFNTLERTDDAGTQYAFPDWWKTFVLIGTNGGGDYYCLRLDSSDQRVWMIGSDCGDKPSVMNSSLEEFIQEFYQDYLQQQQAEQAVRERRRQYLPEMDAHRAWIEENGGSEDGIEWLECESGYRILNMLDRLPQRPSARKMRLFGIANCNLIDGIEGDKDCSHGLEVAFRSTEGTVDEEEFEATQQRLRTRVEQVEGNGTLRRYWMTKAVHHLFQTDQAYRTKTGIYPNDPNLTEAMNACSYAMTGEPYGDDVQRQLLREVLGNPFTNMELDAKWKSDQVVSLARSMYDQDSFDRMPELAMALEEAGCDDQRFIEHCRRSSGHVRGSWVIDQILGLDSQTEQQPWGYSCDHPSVDNEQLKEQLTRFGTQGDLSRDSESDRMVFATWLEQNGDPIWAEYIQLRARLDETPPDDYADLLERSFELETGMVTSVVDLDNVYYSGYEFASYHWWEEQIDDVQFGLPFQFDAVGAGDDPRPLENLIELVDAIVKSTPFRAIDLEDHYVDDLDSILASPPGQELRWLDFENQVSADPTQPSAQIRALCDSAAAKRMHRLTVENFAATDADAKLLAGASFDNLKRITVPYGGVNCSTEALQKLMRCEWFRRLEHLSAEFSENCGGDVFVHMSNMPKLHSLHITRPSGEQLLRLGRCEPFVGLRRLCLSGADLNGEFGEALQQAQFPNLIELYLLKCELESKGLQKLLDSPMCRKLQVLTLALPQIDDELYQQLSSFSFASKLRILRLACGNHDLVGKLSSLGGSGFSHEDGFPNLSTLQIKNPFRPRANQEVSKFLEELKLPKLRHLDLDSCDFDDDALGAMMANESFAGVTSIRMRMSYDAKAKVSPKVFESFCRSPLFGDLLDFSIDRFPVGDGIRFLTDPSILPSLRSASILHCGVPKDLEEAINQARPQIYIL